MEKNACIAGHCMLQGDALLAFGGSLTIAGSIEQGISLPFIVVLESISKGCN